MFKMKDDNAVIQAFGVVIFEDVLRAYVTTAVA